MKNEAKEEMAINEKEEKIIKLIRDIKYGEFKIVIQDGLPVRVEEIRKSIKL